MPSSRGKKCPKCGLINPDTTIICDCGYNFETGSMEITVDRVRKIRQEKLRKEHQVKYKERLWAASAIYLLFYVIPVSIMGGPIIGNLLSNSIEEGSWTWLGCILCLVVMIALYGALLLLVTGFIGYAKTEE